MQNLLMLFLLTTTAVQAQVNYNFIYKDLHKLEELEKDEQNFAEENIAKHAKEQVLKARQGQKDNLVRRDAHAKGHGCVVGSLKINNENLPKELKVGLFKNSSTYKSWIRFSNGNGAVLDDKIPDGRGMAVQLVGVEGEKSLPKDIQEDKFGLFDLIMINHPEFFVKNTTDYVEFFGGAGRFFRTHPYELTIALRTAAHLVTNPLKSPYFSMVPYALGAENAYKFSMEPVSCGDGKNERLDWSYLGHNFMRQNMQSYLNSKNACFNFYVKKFISAAATPVEDPRAKWGDFSTSLLAGSLKIEAQKFTELDEFGDFKRIKGGQDEVCENTSFTPWHSLKVNKPIGSINRTRGVVYSEISRLRFKENKVVPLDKHPVDRKFF